MITEIEIEAVPTCKVVRELRHPSEWPPTPLVGFLSVLCFFLTIALLIAATNFHSNCSSVNREADWKKFQLELT